MKITAVHIRDFKRIREVKIEPDADRTLILIGGKNAQGKSSTLDALSAALGGAAQVPDDPVRHGAGAADITVELDGGALVVRKTIRPGGKSTLELRDEDGVVRSPQTRLDALVGARFLDPLRFLQLDAKAQRAALVSLLPDATEVRKLDSRREGAFNDRTAASRDLKRAQAELDRTPAVAPLAAEEVDVTAAIAELSETQGQLQDHDRGATKLASARSRYTAAAADITRLRAELTAAEERQTKANADGVAAKAEIAALPDAAVLRTRAGDLEATVKNADAANRAARLAQVAAGRRAAAQADVAKLAGQVDELTAKITACDEQRAAILAAAALPIPGLGMTDEGVTLNGAMIANASASERLRCALAIAIATSPNLHDVWIRDAALLDDEALAQVAAHAKEAGVRVWLERVGIGDAGVIEIRDGEVVTS